MWSEIAKTHFKHNKIAINDMATKNKATIIQEKTELTGPYPPRYRWANAALTHFYQSLSPEKKTEKEKMTRLCFARVTSGKKTQMLELNNNWSLIVWAKGAFVVVIFSGE